MTVRKLLVTGLDGFVGPWVREGCSDGWRIFPLIDEAGERVDLTNPTAVRSAVAQIAPDDVLHLAAQSHVPTSFADPGLTLQVNVLGTLHLLQALDGCGFSGSLVMVSSGDTYGLVPECDLPIRETQAQKPRNPYAVSKVAAEALCWQWSQTQSAYKVIIARPFNHIGPGQDPRFAVADFGRQIARIALGKQEAVLRVGDIDATRDFTDVRDVVAAYFALLVRGANGGIYNVCSGRELSLRQVIAELGSLAGVSPRIEQDPQRLRPSEQRRVCGNPSRIAKDTSWTTSISLTTTLSDILAFWKKEASL